MGYVKIKREREKIHAKGHEKKWTRVRIIKQWVLRCPPEKKEEKRNKDSPYFQKGIHSKRERIMIQRSTKNI
jgi:hypothetical protein